MKIITLLALLFITTFSFAQSPGKLEFVGTYDENDSVFIQRINSVNNQHDIWIKVVIPSVPYEYEQGKWTTTGGSATFIKVQINCETNSYDVFKSYSVDKKGDHIQDDNEVKLNNKIKKGSFYEMALKHLCSKG
jgi:hypothetical protein